jgi:hypothetical protein
MHDSDFLAAINLARSCGQARNQQCSSTQSSNYGYAPGPSSFANDGIRDGTKFTSTNLAANNWWRLDFETPRTVAGGMIWNRGNCCPERLDGFKLWVGNNLTYNGEGNMNCYTATSKEHVVSPFTHVFSCYGRGRYFFVHLPSSNFLSLVEIEIMDSG